MFKKKPMRLKICLVSGDILFLLLLTSMFAGGDEERQVTGSASEGARLSYFGRVGYNYKEKYLAEFLWRYDGSDLFPEDHRFGFFPVSWPVGRVSEEKFFKDNVNFIQNLKLRASWGQMGAGPYYNGALVRYGYLGTYGFSSFIINDAVAKTLYETRLPNDNFTWEVGNNTNFGSRDHNSEQ